MTLFIALAAVIISFAVAVAIFAGGAVFGLADLGMKALHAAGHHHHLKA